jgi:hypothetical protein
MLVPSSDAVDALLIMAHPGIGQTLHPAMSANLKRSSWLTRVWEVATPDRTFEIKYVGRIPGYEAVLVDGRVATKVRSWVWFVPRFEFSLGSAPAVLDVRVWPWLTIRSMRLTVEGHICYEEGTD